MQGSGGGVATEELRVAGVTHSHRLGGRRQGHLVVGTLAAVDVSAVPTVMLERVKTTHTQNLFKNAKKKSSVICFAASATPQYWLF